MKKYLKLTSALLLSTASMMAMEQGDYGNKGPKKGSDFKRVGSVKKVNLKDKEIKGYQARKQVLENQLKKLNEQKVSKTDVKYQNVLAQIKTVTNSLNGLLEKKEVAQAPQKLPVKKPAVPLPQAVFELKPIEGEKEEKKEPDAPTPHSSEEIEKKEEEIPEIKSPGVLLDEASKELKSTQASPFQEQLEEIRAKKAEAFKKQYNYLDDLPNPIYDLVVSFLMGDKKSLISLGKVDKRGNSHVQIALERLIGSPQLKTLWQQLVLPSEHTALKEARDQLEGLIIATKAKQDGPNSQLMETNMPYGQLINAFETVLTNEASIPQWYVEAGKGILSLVGKIVDYAPQDLLTASLSEKDPLTRLFMAKMAIKGGANVNQGDNQYGHPPLFQASLHGHTEIVKLLIESGADVKQRDNNGLAFLSWASLHGHTEIVKLLIESGGDVNQRNNDGETPLHKASMSIDPNVVKLLITNGANVNQGDNRGDTPLSWTSYWGRTKMVEFLLTNGANVNQGNNNDHTPLHLASSRGHTEIVKLLLDHPDIKVNQADNDGKTPLYYASWHGRVDAVKLLIEKGANVNLRDNKGKTPLLVARERGHKEIIALLTEAMEK